MVLFDSVQQARGLLDLVTNPEAKLKLLSVLEEALAVSMRNRELEEENSDLKQRLKFKAKVTFKDNVLWAAGESDPYCNGCWEGKDKAVHLTRPGEVGFYRCPVCEKTFNTKPKATQWRSPGNSGMTGYGSALDTESSDDKY